MKHEVATEFRRMRSSRMKGGLDRVAKVEVEA